MDYKIDSKIEAILYKVDLVKDNYPNFSNVWRGYSYLFIIYVD